MERRRFLRSAAGAAAGAGAVITAGTSQAPAAARSASHPSVTARGAAQARGEGSGMKITRVRLYRNPQSPLHFNQSFHVVTVETDSGITGVGEGGSRDTVAQCAAMLIGEDPFRIDHLWQMMFRGYFYPAGREKLDGLGAIDLALWDIKGKALRVPVYQLLGGLARDYVECYSTAFPSHGNLRETARACVAAGFRAFRYSPSDPPAGRGYDIHHAAEQTYRDCSEIREGVGPQGDWALDFHTRFDIPDAVRLATLLEPLEPFFAEDLVRSENPEVYRQLRQQVKLPIAVGEQFGSKWDVNRLVEQQWIDYARVTLPNVGGITEYMKIAALCETHYVGLVPHFTGPIAEAALVHACGAFSGPVLMEVLGEGLARPPHLPQLVDFRDGKMWPNQRPGLGVELDTRGLDLLAEVTERVRPVPMLQRPDGSITNW